MHQSRFRVKSKCQFIFIINLPNYFGIRRAANSQFDANWRCMANKPTRDCSAFFLLGGNLDRINTKKIRETCWIFCPGKCSELDRISRCKLCQLLEFHCYFFKKLKKNHTVKMFVPVNDWCLMATRKGSFTMTKWRISTRIYSIQSGVYLNSQIQ